MPTVILWTFDKVVNPGIQHKCTRLLSRASVTVPQTARDGPEEINIVGRHVLSCRQILSPDPIIWVRRLQDSMLPAYLLSPGKSEATAQSVDTRQTCTANNCIALTFDSLAWAWQGRRQARLASRRIVWTAQHRPQPFCRRHGCQHSPQDHQHALLQAGSAAPAAAGTLQG